MDKTTKEQHDVSIAALIMMSEENRKRIAQIMQLIKEIEDSQDIMIQILFHVGKI